MKVSVDEAKTQLSHLLDLIQDGEEVVIHRHGKPIARLVALAPAGNCPIGAMQGEFELPAECDRPLSADEADAFWEGKW